VNNFLYASRELLQKSLDVVVNLRSDDKTFQAINELRIFVERNSNTMLLQTHCSLKPAVVCASIDITNEVTKDIDITVAAEPLLNCLTKNNKAMFVKITFEDMKLQIQPAILEDGLFGSNEFTLLATSSSHEVIFQHTMLITDYKSVVVNEPSSLSYRKGHLEVFKEVHALACASKKYNAAQFILSNVENSVRIELLSSDSYAHFFVLEHDVESDINVRLDSSQMKFLITATEDLSKSQKGPLELLIIDQSTLVLSCQNIMCEFIPSSDMPFMAIPPKQHMKKGWYVESNEKLQNALGTIVVKTLDVEDIVEIYVQDGEIHFVQATLHAKGSFHTDSTSQVQQSANCPKVVVNRKQFLRALMCFNKYEMINIHGFLTKENQLIIKSSNNDDDVIIISQSDA